MPEEFIEKGHIYLVDGRRIPSVSQVLRLTGVAQDLSMVNPAVLEHRREIGNAVDHAVQFLQENDLDRSTLDLEVAARLMGYERFVRDTGFKVQRIHVRRWAVLGGMSYGMEYDFAGAMDHYAWVIDGKIAEGKPHRSWGIQTAAYTHGAFPPLTAPFYYRRATLQLLGNGKYRFHEWTDSADLQEFQSGLFLVWRRINSGEDIWKVLG
jgi:hypothetical protein